MAEILLKAETSHQIKSSSDFLYNQLKAYLVNLNLSKGYSKTKSLFNKSIETFDYTKQTDKLKLPNKTRTVIWRVSKENSTGKVNNLHYIDIDDNAIDIAISINQVKDKETKKYLRQKLRYKNKEEAFYIVMAIRYSLSEFDKEKADYILENYNYRYIYTLTKKYETVFEFISTFSEVNALHSIYSLLEVLSNDLSFISYVLTSILEENLGYMQTKFSNYLEKDPLMYKKTVNIAILLSSSETDEEFMLSLLNKNRS
ncbi:hypothetical protein ThvES_00017610 [Thiovulum sp. ES]|nr:hypothetical protein ThvES_00017610 [Thiovulum sp. ES]